MRLQNGIAAMHKHKIRLAGRIIQLQFWMSVINFFDEEWLKCCAALEARKIDV